MSVINIQSHSTKPANAEDKPFVYSIGMLLLPGFNCASSTAFLDPFRAANYICGSKVYQWNNLSLNKNPVVASNEFVIADTSPISKKSLDYDLIVINSSWAPERFQSKKLQSWLKAAVAKKITLAAIDTGAFVLAYAGLLNHYRATVHYEHFTAFEEMFRDTHVEESIYVMDRDRLTCSGGTAATDFALRLIQSQSGLELANAAARYIFKDRHRAGNEKQFEHEHEPVGYSMPQTLREAIVLMERNLEDPLEITTIAESLNISQRQMARIFKKFTGLTPVRYYINRRLDRARGYITQTNMQITEVASACGFGTYEQFTRSYFDRFHILPSKDRVTGRIPFQFGSFPTHGSVIEKP